MREFCRWLVIKVIVGKPAMKQGRTASANTPVRFSANRLRNFFPSEWHGEHQIVYVKADLLKLAGRVRGGVAI